MRFYTHYLVLRLYMRLQLFIVLAVGRISKSVTRIVRFLFTSFKAYYISQGYISLNRVRLCRTEHTLHCESANMWPDPLYTYN